MNNLFVFGTALRAVVYAFVSDVYVKVDLKNFTWRKSISDISK